MKKFSLQSKIILLFSTVIISTMSIAIIFNSYTFNDAVKKTYVSQLKGITTTINGGYEESRSIENVQTIFDYIKHREKNVLKLSLHVMKENRHTIMASTDRSSIGMNSPEALSLAFESGETLIAHSEVQDTHLVRMVAPLLEDGMTVGAIEIYLDDSKEIALIQNRIMLITIVGLIISLVLIILLSVIIRRLLVLPLMTLREAAVSIQHGKEYEDVKLNASQEINEVAAAFNEMVYNLEDRYQKSVTDSLTGIYNSAYFKQKLSEVMKDAAHYNQSMALLFCDIDNFKKLNDHEGHLYGDEVLKQISKVILNHVRTHDIVCRYGGEEFVIIMPNTDAATAKSIAEEVRHMVAINGHQSILTPITISIGIAVFPQDADEENIVHIADQAMYTAKSLGKNRVVAAQDLPSHKKQDYQRKIDDQKWILDTIISLTKAVELKDSYTHSHSEMVSKYAGTVASSMGLTDEEVKKISIAGLLHDVGKIGVPDHILNKEGRLTEEEYEIMKTHPVLGYNILACVDELEDTLPYVLYHHERPDGKGYPQGLRSDEIPLGARIIGVVDAFHSMTSERPYRKNPLSLELALEQLRKGQGTQFDHEVVDHFIQIIGEMKIIQNKNPRMQ
ncbi:diguanylate cyclase [Bacillus sp. SCS-153A]|uniref:bifunctional diguanylate cyclase/phosphohydrolase n=1 Tax=Rossellomorea sedimentorum TaxID=3115294 RepID=UPI003905EB02